MAFTFDEVLVFKKDLDEKFNVYLHFHDACAGQYFSLDEKDATTENAQNITRYFKDKNINVSFSDDYSIIKVEN